MVQKLWTILRQILTQTNKRRWLKSKLEFFFLKEKHDLVHSMIARSKQESYCTCVHITLPQRSGKHWAPSQYYTTFPSLPPPQWHTHARACSIHQHIDVPVIATQFQLRLRKKFLSFITSVTKNSINVRNITSWMSVT